MLSRNAHLTLHLVHAGPANYDIAARHASVAAATSTDLLIHLRLCHYQELSQQRSKDRSGLLCSLTPCE
jgi:hypothetical protein